MIGRNKPTFPFLLVCLGLLLVLSSCGGGGGGGSDDQVYPATIAIDTDPGTIDSGDITFTHIDIYDVAPGGVVLKIKFPIALTYQTGSSIVEVDGVRYDTSPDFHESNTTDTYLVYIYRREDFGDSNYARLTIQLKGRDATTDATGKIQVDADFNDPLVSTADKFSITDPQFDADDEVSITISDGSTGTGGSGGTAGTGG